MPAACRRAVRELPRDGGVDAEPRVERLDGPVGPECDWRDSRVEQRAEPVRIVDTNRADPLLRPPHVADAVRGLDRRDGPSARKRGRSAARITCACSIRGRTALRARRLLDLFQRVEDEGVGPVPDGVDGDLEAGGVDQPDQALQCRVARNEEPRRGGVVGVRGEEGGGSGAHRPVGEELDRPIRSQSSPIPPTMPAACNGPSERDSCQALIRTVSSPARSRSR